MGIGDLGLAAFFLTWNAARLYLSPFLKFALNHSIHFVLSCGFATALGVLVYAAPTTADRYFVITIIGVLGLPIFALWHVWKATHYKDLFAAFEAGRDSPR